jgi:hypothetical protein
VRTTPIKISDITTIKQNRTTSTTTKNKKPETRVIFLAWGEIMPSLDDALSMQSYNINTTHIGIVIVVLVGLAILYKYHSSRKRRKGSASLSKPVKTTGLRSLTRKSKSTTSTTNPPTTTLAKPSTPPPVAHDREETRMFGGVLIQTQSNPSAFNGDTINMARTPRNELVQTNKNEWVVVKVDPETRELVRV